VPNGVGVGLDLVSEDEVGAGIAGSGGSELVAERGQGLGALVLRFIDEQGRELDRVVFSQITGAI
jgi:hypothetical protein